MFGVFKKLAQGDGCISFEIELNEAGAQCNDNVREITSAMCVGDTDTES